MSDLPAILTVEEVAVLLRVSRGHAYRLAREGLIPGVVRLGKTLRVSRDALLPWMLQGCASEKGEP
jgi:excisionase family DNA binding protein